MIILTGEGTFWRDMGFDRSTGDVYLREGNNVIAWDRTGDNSVSNSRIIFDPLDADFVGQQNLCVIPTASGIPDTRRSSAARRSRSPGR